MIRVIILALTLVSADLSLYIIVEFQRNDKLCKYNVMIRVGVQFKTSRFAIKIKNIQAPIHIYNYFLR